MTVLTHPGAAADAPKKILFFSKSGSFEHPAIHEDNGRPSLAQRILTELALQGGRGATAGATAAQGAHLNPNAVFNGSVEFVFTKDGTMFTPENIKKYDAFFFYTQGELTKRGVNQAPPMNREGIAALLEAIHGGKGFIGTHSASDTLHSDGSEAVNAARWKNDGDRVSAYVRMIGGEFIIHGSQQKARQIVINPHFPGMGAVPPDFGPLEEWYSLKNFAPDLHVLLVQDTSAMDKTGDNQRAYARPNFPSTWVHPYGKGRVFFTSMGHREDIWTNPVFQELLVGGINWVLGTLPADASPNLDRAAPQASTLPAPQ